MNVQYPMGGLRGARTISVVRDDQEVITPPSEEGLMAAKIPARAEAVAKARHQLGKLLQNSGLSECADTAVLAAQELMVNAMVHGCGSKPALQFFVRATREGGRLRVEVEDPSIEQPHPRPAASDEEGGRGLHLVDALVARWGTDSATTGSGKTVWFELDLATEEGAS
ncbi:ATP-binding protein [Streptomyces sp. NPDC004549]|uniref:ATP-binding protein n=1 Tax=Streptomyces sp. NPDC004549 TaxID=3154283 RepID=UPI00339EDEDF